YASTNFDAYKKVTIPNNKKCMTKAEVQQYISVQPTPLNPYLNNQLIRRDKVVGKAINYYCPTFDGSITGIEFQNDGRLTIVGTFNNFNAINSPKLIQLNIDGTRDTSFEIGSGFTGTPYTVAIHTDNKILVGGLFVTYQSVSVGKIIRLNADGTL